MSRTIQYIIHSAHIVVITCDLESNDIELALEGQILIAGAAVHISDSYCIPISDSYTRVEIHAGLYFQ
jgi:hypothetical protein